MSKNHHKTQITIIRNIIKKPKLFKLLLDRIGLIQIPDTYYFELAYEAKFGYKPNLENPKTFNEKIQWMKLYYRKPELPRLVDKITAKEEVAKIIGKQYIIPTIGIYNKFDDINFDKLPDQFVIKL